VTRILSLGTIRITDENIWRLVVGITFSVTSLPLPTGRRLGGEEKNLPITIILKIIFIQSVASCYRPTDWPFPAQSWSEA
jgi:hypothetical protein